MLYVQFYSLFEQKKIDARMLWGWLLTKKKRRYLERKWSVGVTTRELPHPLGVFHKYDTSYYFNIYVSKMSAKRAVKYYDTSGVQVGDTDYVVERVNAISDPDDDATDVTVDPYSITKSNIDVVETMFALAIALKAVPNATIDGIIDIGEDEFRQVIEAGRGTLDNSVRFPVREHTSDAIGGTVTITEVKIGDPPFLGGTFISEEDLPPSSWVVNLAETVADRQFKFGVARRRKYRYFWRCTTYGIGIETLPNGLHATGTVESRIVLPANPDIVKVTVDDVEIATKSGSTWSVSGSLPSYYNATLV
jgi:hypothetical protein